jgi:hypothetical protein
MIAQTLASLLVLFSLLLGSVKLVSLGHHDSKFMRRSAVEITKILRREKSFYCSSNKATMLEVKCHELYKKIHLQFKEK